jgi:hypothetical protein
MEHNIGHQRWKHRKEGKSDSEISLLARVKNRVRWEAYIAAMRGIMASHPPDPNRIDAQISRLRA